MSSLNQLTDFYYKELEPELKALEKERKVLRSRIIMILSFIAFLTLFFMLFTARKIGMDDTILFIAFGGFAFGGFIYKLLIKDYTQQFKQDVIRPLIKAIDHNLHYNPNHAVAEALFSFSDLFSNKIDRYSGNDHVKGEIDGVSIEFSDVHAEQRHSGSKGKQKYTTIFQGLFIIADFNKNFKGHTTILPDSAENIFGSLIGGWLQSNNFSQNDLIKMDDPQFEKEFVVYGSDQIESRYILTHAMMKRLLDLRHKAKHQIHISFKGSKVFIAIDYRDDLFEPTIFSSLLDYKTAMMYVQTLHMATGIINELKLNHKLWSKK